MSGPEKRFPENIAYCTDEVSKGTPDLMLAAQFAPPGERDRLMALYAFGLEIHKIPATVSEPPLGAIRQQWWREALDEAFGDGGVRMHPVAEALRVSIGVKDGLETGRAIRPLMDEAIDAMGWYLDGETFPDPKAILKQAEATHGSLAVAAGVLLAGDGLPAKDRAVIRRLEAVAAIARQLGLQGAEDRSKALGGLIATMSERLVEYSETDDNGDRLRRFLAEEYQANRKATKRLPTSVMPVVAQAALIPGHLKAAARLQKDRALTVSRFADFSRKLRVTKAVMTGAV